MTPTELQLRQIEYDLRLVRSQVASFRDAVRTCVIGIKMPVVDERALLRTTAELHPKLASLRLRLDAMSAQIPQLSRRTHRTGSTSAFGLLGNARGMLPIVERELQQCHTELRAAHAEIKSVLDSPTRSSSEPTGGLMELFDLALDLIAKALQRWK